MVDYVLSERAESHIDDVYRYGLVTFGQAAARSYIHNLFRQFDLIAEFPDIGQHLSIGRHSFLRFGYGVHIIIYSKDGNAGIVIEAIFDGRSDYMTLL